LKGEFDAASKTGSGTGQMLGSQKRYGKVAIVPACMHDPTMNGFVVAVVLLINGQRIDVGA
jgi:hypothetical protein